MKNDFEDFLKDIHAEDYMGTDDDMPDSFDNWLVALDVDEWIKYGNQYVEKFNYCTRCSHKWYPRNPTPPKVCPKCKSPYWNVEKKIKS